jgi:hypothetical protein
MQILRASGSVRQRTFFDGRFRWRQTEKCMFLRRNRWRVPSAGLVGRVGHTMSMNDVVLKYPIWQEPYRAAVIEINPTLLKLKIAAAQQAAILRLKQLENSADHHHELIALTDALTALKILGETIWAE